MGKYGKGALAGFVAGLIQGIIGGVLIFLATLALGGWIALAGIVLGPFLIISAIGAGIIGGLIFGLIFAALYNYLPGVSSVKKSLCLSIIFWIILGVLLQYPFIIANPLIAVVNLISALIYGAILGKLWDTFK